MRFSLTKTYPRLWSLDTGIVMVVTDLHGDWDAYQRYRDRFVDLQAAGQADCLVFTGDLIHGGDSSHLDRSLEIVLDVLALRATYGEAIIYLCGNHELPHLYGMVLSKGSTEYTPAFEAALSQSGHRSAVIDLFDSLPFFLRTTAGVCITHAGASRLPTDDAAQALFSWSHRELRIWADQQLACADLAELRSGYAKLSGEVSYKTMARRYLAVDGPADPRYDDLLRGFLTSGRPEFRLVRSALFTRCEHEHSETGYADHLVSLIEHLSDRYAPQQALVAGHLTVVGGHTTVAGRHLRLASATHATPREAAQYLLFDTTQPIRGLDDLRSGLHSAF